MRAHLGAEQGSAAIDQNLGQIEGQICGASQ